MDEETMRLHRLEVDLSAKPVRVFSATDDPQGEHGLSDQELKNLTHVYIQVESEDKRQWTDMLWSMGLNTVISHRARKALSQFADDSIRFIGTTITRKGARGTNWTSDYFVMIASQSDPLDYTQSDIEFFRTTPPTIKRIKRWVLKRDAIPVANIFLTRQNDWFVSDKVAEEIKEQRLVGISLFPTECR